MAQIIEIIPCDTTSRQPLPLFLSKVRAGFPSPADEYLDKKLDLNEFLIHHPTTTFFVKVKGDSMMNSGIHSGDLLIVDRSLEAKDNHVVVAVLNGEFTVKRIKRKKDKIFLQPENNTFKPIELTLEMDFQIWGVVMHVIHSFKI